MIYVYGMDTSSERWQTVGPNDESHAGFVIPGSKKGLTKKLGRKPVEGEDYEPNDDIRRAHLRKSFREYMSNQSMMLEDGDQIHLFCEEPLAMRNGKVTRMLSLAGGALWTASLDIGFFWHWVNISHWKKEIVGNGNADKDEIQAHLLIEGLVFPEPDHYDACCIRRYGVQELAKTGVEVVP